MTGKDIQEQLRGIRDQLDVADRDPIAPRQIGRILVSLSKLTDLIEATNKRIDDVYDYAAALSNPYR